MDYYAHSLSGRPLSEWEPLIAHLKRVAILAAARAEVFGAKEWAYVLGLMHDLGKYSVEFQNYLLRANDAHIEDGDGKKVDHSTAGAQVLFEFYSQRKQPQFGLLLAYCVAGHHAGLADGTSDFGSEADLCSRLKKEIPVVSPEKLAELLGKGLPPLGPPSTFVFSNERRERAFQLSLFCRMLFSALVDADFLATEEFMNAEQAEARSAEVPELGVMGPAVVQRIKELSGAAKSSPINAYRQSVLDGCIDAGRQPPGFFSLSVPTGGGKTRSSLAFALTHALEHKKRRVIYAIPFTSIIEQTAQEYRKLLGPFAEHGLVEHHSNLDPDKETPRSRLSSENWDAPVVVTTNVQFFESLFAKKTSRCRKLHNIAGSVIILDEVQTIPIEFLTACLAVLKELVRNYGCTVVLCSATQPTFGLSQAFPIGLENVREIIPDRAGLFSALRRVTTQNIGPQSDDALTDRMARHPAGLCIVSTRGHASRLYRAMIEKSPARCVHLSATMCPEHRSAVLAEIRRRLKEKESLWVVSTQLIEAGVDVDFPVVYRAMAGLDSIAQAAGRCNREGAQKSGTVYVFDTDQIPPALSFPANTTRELLSAGMEDMLDLASMERFFTLHYRSHRESWDKKSVMACFSDVSCGSLKFSQAASLFSFIEDIYQPVIIPWGQEGERLVQRLRAPVPVDRLTLRKLQRYTVTIPQWQFRKCVGSDVEVVADQFNVLQNSSMYDEELGFRFEKLGVMEPEYGVL